MNVTCESCGHKMEVEVEAGNGMKKKWDTKEMLPDDVLNFGKFKGRTLREAYEEDPDYYEWLISNKVISLTE